MLTTRDVVRRLLAGRERAGGGRIQREDVCSKVYLYSSVTSRKKQTRTPNVTLEKKNRRQKQS